MTHITISRTHTNLPFNILIDIIRIKTFFHRSLKEEEEVRATRLGKQQPSAVASGGGHIFCHGVCAGRQERTQNSKGSFTAGHEKEVNWTVCSQDTDTYEDHDKEKHGVEYTEGKRGDETQEHSWRNPQGFIDTLTFLLCAE